MTNQQIKNRFKVVQTILSSPNFYYALCSKAGNDINKAISLLSKIIAFILNSDVEKIDFDNIGEIEQNDYVIYPTNSYYYQRLNMFGLCLFALNKQENDFLTKLDMSLSFYPINANYNYLEFYQDPEEAINVAHISPSIVFSHILKQPQSSEEPIIVGATEASYYLSVLNNRLNIKNNDNKTNAKKAQKVITSFVENDALLVIIPKNALDPDDLRHGIITSAISRNQIGLIRIPSRYTLIQICAHNKRLKEGTKLSISDGKTPVEKDKIHVLDVPFSYTRYEKVCIDDTFDYEADNLTGDASYDIDIMYGANDYHESRKKISTNPEKNIEFIKNSSSMLLTYRGHRVKIENGRHRLIYMKKYFLDHIDECVTEDQKRYLREKCSVVVSVTRTFEDEQVLQTIKNIKDLIPNAFISKNNFLNDDVDLIIMINRIMYNLKDKNELIDFYNNLKNNKPNSKYGIATISNKSLLEPRGVVGYLFDIFKNDIVKYSFSNIVEYIKYNGIKKDGKTYGIDSINLFKLFLEFNKIITVLNYYSVANKKPDYSIMQKI